MEKNILEVKIGDRIRPFKEEIIEYYTKQEYLVKSKIKKIKSGDLSEHFIKVDLMGTDGVVNEFTFNKNLTVFVEE